MSAVAEKYEPRLRKVYRDAVVPELLKQLKLENVHEAPRVEKVVVNMGVSQARENAQILDVAKAELAAITGQAPEIRRAKKSISNFKLRTGMPIGVRATLRGSRMWEFLDRLIATAIPRIRDFQGLERKGFDGSGNYNLGLREQTLFLEIDPEKATTPHGMNISIVTTAKDDAAAILLLEMLGMPFKKPRKGAGAKEK